jgi:protein gp37
LANVHVHIGQARDQWRNLAEIHAAPEWLWPAMVARMIEGEWTVATTRQMVANYKGAGPPPDWCNAEAIANALLIGQLSLPDLDRLYSYPERVNITDADLKQSLMDALRTTRPSRLSEVQAIANEHEQIQDARRAEQRRLEAEAQRTQEQAQQRVARLLKNCSLEEWQALNGDERALLTAPPAGDGGTFNQQKGDSIEWAQWSWNPVTGCKHDCPYCYARDIAMSERMQQASLYPNGWEPTFRSLALNGPKNTKVPKNATTDTRYRNVFTCSMADLFGRWVPKEWIDAVMMSVRGNPQWNFLFLTKFPQRFAELEIPDNAWMGTTVDMQARVKNAEKAFSAMRGTGVRWLSVEPMIEPIRLERPDLFNWVVIGGASASKQTPAWQPPYRWIESLVRQCDEAGVPVYMKSNLGIANRVLQLPFDAPIQGDPQRAPEPFHYLKSGN